MYFLLPNLLMIPSKFSRAVSTEPFTSLLDEVYAGVEMHRLKDAKSRTRGSTDRGDRFSERWNNDVFFFQGAGVQSWAPLHIGDEVVTAYSLFHAATGACTTAAVHVNPEMAAAVMDAQVETVLAGLRGVPGEAWRVDAVRAHVGPAALAVDPSRLSALFAKVKPRAVTDFAAVLKQVGALHQLASFGGSDDSEPPPKSPLLIARGLLDRVSTALLDGRVGDETRTVASIGKCVAGNMVATRLVFGNGSGGGGGDFFHRLWIECQSRGVDPSVVLGAALDVWPLSVALTPVLGASSLLRVARDSGLASLERKLQARVESEVAWEALFGSEKGQTPRGVVAWAAVIWFPDLIMDVMGAVKALVVKAPADAGNLVHSSRTELLGCLFARFPSLTPNLLPWGDAALHQGRADLVDLFRTCDCRVAEGSVRVDEDEDEAEDLEADPETETRSGVPKAPRMPNVTASVKVAAVLLRGLLEVPSLSCVSEVVCIAAGCNMWAFLCDLANGVVVRKRESVFGWGTTGRWGNVQDILDTAWQVVRRMPIINAKGPSILSPRVVDMYMDVVFTKLGMEAFDPAVAFMLLFAWEQSADVINARWDWVHRCPGIMQAALVNACSEFLFAAARNSFHSRVAVGRLVALVASKPLLVRSFRKWGLGLDSVLRLMPDREVWTNPKSKGDMPAVEYVQVLAGPVVRSMFERAMEDALMTAVSRYVTLTAVTAIVADVVTAYGDVSRGLCTVLSLLARSTRYCVLSVIEEVATWWIRTSDGKKVSCLQAFPDVHGIVDRALYDYVEHLFLRAHVKITAVPGSGIDVLIGWQVMLNLALVLRTGYRPIALLLDLVTVGRTLADQGSLSVSDAERVVEVCVHTLMKTPQSVFDHRNECMEACWTLVKHMRENGINSGRINPQLPIGIMASREPLVVMDETTFLQFAEHFGCVFPTVIPDVAEDEFCAIGGRGGQGVGVESLAGTPKPLNSAFKTCFRSVADCCTCGAVHNAFV